MSVLLGTVIVAGVGLAFFMNGKRITGGAMMLAGGLLLMLNFMAEAKKAGLI